MTEINWDTLSDQLTIAVPALSEQYRKMLGDWEPEKPGAHVVFGDILNPYLMSELATEHDIPGLKSIFDFLETLAKCPDVRVREVVQVTVCERLGGDKTALKKAYPYMGQATRMLSDKTERFWREGDASR